MEEQPDTWAIDAAKLIIADLKDRHGLAEDWDGVDKEMQEEILLDWARIIEANQPSPPGG